jgi:hypothetical protein
MKTGYWKLTWEPTSSPEITELTDEDRVHIGLMIREGCIEGEIIQEDEEEN